MEREEETRSPHPSIQFLLNSLEWGRSKSLCVCAVVAASLRVCVRLDKAEEWRRVIEISIKEVISGVIAEVLWCECVLVCVCV